MSIRKTLVALLIIFALVPATADASRDPVKEAGRLATLATGWWAVKGYDACGTIQIGPASALLPPGKWAWAYPWLCRIDLGPEPIRMLANARRRYVSAFGREMACTLIFHEVGHLAGLGHSPGGVMAEDASIYGYPPGPCFDYGTKGLSRSERHNYRLSIDWSRSPQTDA